MTSQSSRRLPSHPAANIALAATLAVAVFLALLGPPPSAAAALPSAVSPAADPASVGAGTARPAARMPAAAGGSTAAGAGGGAGTGTSASASDRLPAVAAKVGGMERRGGLLDLYLDRAHGKVWLVVPPPPSGSGGGGVAGRYLYVEGIETGMGSNAVGLDRGQASEGHVVDLRRVGTKVLFEMENLRFRALSERAEERRAVHDSFAPSVVWGGEVVAEDADGRALVDFTSFVVRDAHGIVQSLRVAKQGKWTLDAARSAADLDACKAFPENVELVSVLTYGSEEPGPLVRATVPRADSMTFVAHQSLLRLPDDGYRPRRLDPRAGSFGVEFLDYSAPLGAGMDVHWVARHRLEKTDPTAARSTVKKPLVYYIDNAAPEPIRSALVEGVGWWKEAFDKAGFIDAFRVEVLPEGIDPMDARYNVVEWVHRATRGWSYGGGIVDPRTGEMVNGHVTLGSLRIRQDILLFEGLLGTAHTGSGAPDDPVQLALARIRQLGAHEVGHSLGLMHNFAASTYGRASVMDYPAPLVTVAPGGGLDVSHAYATGVGEWDVQAIRYAYTEFPPGPDHEARERDGLDAILQENLRRGLLYLTDEDARPPGAAAPLANLWDNGADPVAGLEQTLAVRRVALARFGAANVAPGRPLTTLQEVLVPLYLHHRYQLEAAVKVVGGLDYAYSVRGEGPQEAHPVDAAWQRRALAAVVGTLTPETLDLPESVVRAILPRAPGHPANIELFTGGADPAFDPLSAAATAADMAVSGLLQRERAQRLVDFHRRDPSLPSFEEVMDALIAGTFGGGGHARSAGVAERNGAAARAAAGRNGAGAAAVEGHGSGAAAEARRAELRRVVQWVVVRRMMDLAANPEATPSVRERVEGRLARLARELGGGRRPAGAGAAAAPAIAAAAPATAGAAGGEERAHRTMLAAEITRYLDRQAAEPAQHAEPPPEPPGQPIGGAATPPWGLGAPDAGLPPTLGGCSWDDQ